jgi:pyridoxamine-phosphate oxidase
MDAVPEKIQVTTHATYDAPGSLTPASVDPSPLTQFRKWFTEAQGIVSEPEAMAISTTTASTPPVPSVRFVLLKTVDARGFIFYTNYSSRKSLELSATGRAALAFYWREQHRQVRVVGRVERVTVEESEEYYKTRPVGSQLGAWASPQSSVVGEAEVKRRLEEVEDRFGLKSVSNRGDVDIPRPDFWGGWRVIPESAGSFHFHFLVADNLCFSEVEFWSGKPSRLHDRVRYLRLINDQWKIDRLAP